MLYTVIDITLIVALAATTIFSLVMYRELRKFKAISGEYATILRETSRAVDNVERAVAGVHEDGAATLIALGERIDAARRTIDALKSAESTAAGQMMRLQVERARASRADTGSPSETPPEPAMPRAVAPEAAMPTMTAGATPCRTPIFARSVRTRKTFEWPVVKSASLTAQEA